MKRVAVGVAVLLLAAGSLGGLFLRSELKEYRAAFLYAFGPYEFVRSVQDLSKQRQAPDSRFTEASMRAGHPDWTGGAFLNRHAHNPSLADHRLRTVTTPNNDTLYTSAVLELSSTPVVVNLPDSGSRYLSVALMDVFTDQFAHIGPRETQGLGATYWIVGPGDTTVVPDNVTVIRAPCNDVWLLARTFVAGNSDLAAAQAVQQGITVRPVFPERSESPFATTVTGVEDSENFLAVVNEALARNSAHPQAQRALGFAALGLGPDGTTNPLSRRLWSLVTARAESSLQVQIDTRIEAGTGWSVPPKTIGFYGEDDETRSAVTLIGFGALRRQDALYFLMRKTEDGEVLDGSIDYTFTLPADVPAQAFWSIALYEPDETGRLFFFDNPTGRHSLNSGSDTLRMGPEGEHVFRFSRDKPKESEVNWMPTPEGPFVAAFRLYLPKPDAVRDLWAPPTVNRNN